jgi:hypothetical protein
MNFWCECMYTELLYGDEPEFQYARVSYVKHTGRSLK